MKQRYKSETPHPSFVDFLTTCIHLAPLDMSEEFPELSSIVCLHTEMPTVAWHGTACWQRATCGLVGRTLSCQTTAAGWDVLGHQEENEPSSLSSEGALSTTQEVGKFSLTISSGHPSPPSFFLGEMLFPSIPPPVAGTGQNCARVG